MEAKEVQSHCGCANILLQHTSPKPNLSNPILQNQVRSVMRAYAGEAHRRINLATILFWPLSGHRPVICQASHARIPKAAPRIQPLGEKIH